MSARTVDAGAPTGDRDPHGHPSHGGSLPEGPDPKARIRAGEPLRVLAVDAGTTEGELRGRIASDGADLLFVDTQHAPFDEHGLASFCALAARLGAPAAVRIRHPEEAHLAGRYADFGALAVIVPQVARPETVRAAIASFYYPPLGGRSWGPRRALGFAGRDHGYEYAPWWNAHGILMIQIECVEGVARARELALPGLDLITFGINDLTLNIQANPGAPFRTFEACREQVAAACAGTGVRVSQAPMPIGVL